MERQEQYMLEPYGSRAQVKEVAERVRRFLPGGSKLTEDEALALGQLAVAYGLNPFNGEVWYVKDERSGRSYGTMVGLKGLRKAARSQAGYQIMQRSMDEGQRNERGLGPQDVGRICEVYRVDYGLLTQRPPLPFVGEGVAKAGERTPATKTLVWLADKRAEADALKKAFDLPFGVYEDGNGYEEVAVKVTTVEEPVVIDAPVTPSEPPAVSKGRERPVVRTARWGGAVVWVGDHTSHYNDHNGKPNPWHMLSAAAQLGYSEVTDENVEALAQKLVERVVASEEGEDHNGRE